MPYLNIDDGMDEHPKVEGLSDAAFRLLVREACAWSRSGTAGHAPWAVSSGLVRLARRYTLPRWLVPLRHRARISAEVRRAVYDRDGWACGHCGATERLTLDHIHPWSLGGEDAIENLQTLCQSCNSRKGVRVQCRT